MSEPIPPARPGATAYGAETTAPEYSDRPVAFRGPESLGGLLLILAGVAAGISLLLDWLKDRDISGWSLVRRGFDALCSVFHNGMWQSKRNVLGVGSSLIHSLYPFLRL